MASVSKPKLSLNHLVPFSSLLHPPLHHSPVPQRARLFPQICRARCLTLNRSLLSYHLLLKAFLSSPQLCASQPIDNRCCVWTSPCGSQVCKMPSTITIRKLGEKKKKRVFSFFFFKLEAIQRRHNGGWVHESLGFCFYWSLGGYQGFHRLTLHEFKT